jgi:hypothetical protein
MCNSINREPDEEIGGAMRPRRAGIVKPAARPLQPRLAEALTRS